jgi:hypothetical protein
MDFSNWTGWKSVKLLLGASTVFAASMALGFPGTVTAHDFTAAGIVLGSLTSAVTILSGTNAGPVVAKTPEQIAAVKAVKP